MSRLIIIRGVPGSGKTKVAEEIADHLYALHFEANMWRYNDEGEYIYDPKDNKRCHKECQKSVREALEMGIPVVVANTFTREWQVKPYLEMASDLDIPVDIVVCKGNFQNVHNVPNSSVETMRQQFEPIEGEKTLLHFQIELYSQEGI